MVRKWVLFWALGAASLCRGQAPHRGPIARQPAAAPGNPVPSGAAVVLRLLAARAGVIFAGHVLELNRQDAAGYVDITFAIDQAVRGCTPATQYVLREWAGLWIGNPPRYAVGQRLVMILPPRATSGLSAPLGGMAGAIPLLAMRQPPIATASGSAPADSPAEDALEPAVDLRWIETLQLRTVSPPREAQPEAITARHNGWSGLAAALPNPSAPALSALLAVLRER